MRSCPSNSAVRAGAGLVTLAVPASLNAILELKTTEAMTIPLSDGERGYLAEDALQGAFINAWRQLPSLRDPDRFDAWIRKVLVHACYAEARRRRSWAANVRVLPVDGPAGPDDFVSIDERDALDRLIPDASGAGARRRGTGVSGMADL